MTLEEYVGQCPECRDRTRFEENVGDNCATWGCAGQIEKIGKDDNP